jgi:hypothetical protein
MERVAIKGEGLSSAKFQQRNTMSNGRISLSFILHFYLTDNQMFSYCEYFNQAGADSTSP